ncbi:hypothetical protein [Methanosarcina barkeri]|uniref:hypothetical protein n=1 Tax=Methanosarcina barkeri TaxID=2208 RepID=UPI000AF220B0
MLWVLGYAEKSKIRVMAIKDRIKQPLYMAELLIKDSYKGPRPLKIRLFTGKKKRRIHSSTAVYRAPAQCKPNNACRRRKSCK